MTQDDLSVPLALLASPFVPPNNRDAANVELRGDRLVCVNTGREIPLFRGVPDCRLPDDGEIEGKRDAFADGLPAVCRSAALSAPTYLSQVEAIAALIQKHCRDRSLLGPTLEIGCGMGVLADRLPGYVGLDYLMGLLQAQGYELIARVCGSANNLPFRTSAFGTVVTNNALEHVPDVHLAFAEIDRVLRPGGLLLLKMAWHCTKYNNLGVPNRPYSDLALQQKVIKAILPILKSPAYKFVTRIPARVVRRACSRWPTRLQYRLLTPSMNDYGLPDYDAYCDVDSHEGLLYFESRGYECLSHASYVSKILARQDAFAFRKPL
jgi:SAM-dependent methyltransferase